MPKHRGTVYVVMRERQTEAAEYEGDGYIFSALIGTYETLQRAEEVVGASAQALRDAGASDGDYRFSVKAVTYYAE